MNQSPLISIVIPVFNGEDTLAACLDSALRQSYPTFEILVVNDGSTDGTGEVVVAYSRRDSRVKFFDIPNHGVNFARQLAVNHSQGRFVTFLDADDQLLENALEMYLKHIEDHDILLANCFADKPVGQDEYLSLMLDELLPKELWGKLFKRALLTQEVMALPGDIVMGEDFIWNVRMAGALKSVRLVKDNYYRYNNQNAGSAMHRFKKSVSYEKLFMEVLNNSLRSIGKSESEVYDLLTVQRFNAFTGLVRANELAGNDAFIRYLARPTVVLRSKRNMILYQIMSLSNLRLKIVLVRFYFILYNALFTKKS